MAVRCGHDRSSRGAGSPSSVGPGVTLSVVECITGIVVVFGDPGLPLCHSQFSVEKVANLSLTSDLSQLGRLSSREVVGYSHSVVA